MTKLELFLKEKFGITNVERMDIFEAAFTHSSYKGDYPYCTDYERLELLGDAIITLIVIEKLYHEGYSLKDICLQKKGLVSRVALSWVAEDIGLDQLLRIGRGCTHITSSMMCDIFESFVAAIYLAVGFDKAKEVIEKTVYQSYIERRLVLRTDYKTKLQEWAQSQAGVRVEYHTSGGGGSRRPFRSKVYYKETEIGCGMGTRHKNAEQDAARAALINLKLIEQDQE